MGYRRTSCNQGRGRPGEIARRLIAGEIASYPDRRSSPSSDMSTTARPPCSTHRHTEVTVSRQAESTYSVPEWSITRRQITFLDTRACGLPAARRGARARSWCWWWLRRRGDASKPGELPMPAARAYPGCLNKSINRMQTRTGFASSGRNRAGPGRWDTIVVPSAKRGSIEDLLGAFCRCR
jgi:hypothetical protein